MMQADIFDYLEEKCDEILEETKRHKLIVSVILDISKFERLNFRFNSEREIDGFIESLEIESMKESQTSGESEKLYILLVHRNKFINRYMKGNRGS